MNDHLDWSFALPRGWEAKPLRALCEYWVSNADKLTVEGEEAVRLCNYSDVYNNEFISLDLPFMSATATQLEIQRFRLQVGDVLITKDSESWDDIGVPALVCQTADDLICGYHLAMLRPRADRLYSRFLFRSLQAKPVRTQLELAANGVTRFGIPKSDIGAMWLPLPPLPQQRAIADYLDRETAHIDALSAAKERLLTLLAEKRRALITQAVTRGLDPAAPLRNSGVEWLGQIPAHWEVWKLVHFAVVGNGSTPSRSNSEYWSGGTIPWLTSGSVNQDPIIEANEFVTELAVTECHLTMVPKGSILVGNTGQGKTRGQAALLLIDATINQNVASVTPRLDCVEPWCLRWLFYAAYQYIRCISDDSGRPEGALTRDELASIRLPLPPLAEQRAIVAHITAATARLDALASAARRSIALLKERRAALIAAAVTGKVNLPA